MAKGKQTPQDAGGTEAIWVGSAAGASMVSLRGTEAMEARGYEGKWLQLLGVPTLKSSCGFTDLKTCPVYIP